MGANVMTIIESNVSVLMRRDTICGLPDHALPQHHSPAKQYSLRPYRSGDAAHWTRIHLAADQYNEFTPDSFAVQFGEDETILSERQFFLCAGDETIGTATAWWNDSFEGAAWGQVHWVAIAPPFQGRGLAKPLLCAVCRRLQELGHERIFLDTSTARVPAIRLYQSFGFVPHIRNQTDVFVWRALGRAMNKQQRG